jgi:hypothetical protein
MGMKIAGHSQRAAVKTMHGTLELRRAYYYCRNCGYGACPDDEAYGLLGNEHRMTKALMLEVAYIAQNQVSFDKAERMMDRAYGIAVSRETVRDIAEALGAKAFGEDARQAQALYEDIANLESDKKEPGVVYLMVDGAAVNTRVEDENGSTWRENKLGIAFSDKSVIRRKDGGGIIVKKEIVPVVGPVDAFKKHALLAAVKAGYGRFREAVVIGDGAHWIHNMSDELFPDAVQILDLFHLKENIYGYSKYLHGQDNARMVAWAESVTAKIEDHYDVDGALSLIPQGEEQPQGVVNLRAYIENNRGRINYPEYKKKGYYVGSGAIESANKTIVQQRLKRAGMRWGVSGAQAMLTLRAKDESGRWDDVERCA